MQWCVHVGREFRALNRNCPSLLTSGGSQIEIRVVFLEVVLPKTEVSTLKYFPTAALKDLRGRVAASVKKKGQIAQCAKRDYSETLEKSALKDFEPRGFWEKYFPFRKYHLTKKTNSVHHAPQAPSPLLFSRPASNPLTPVSNPVSGIPSSKPLYRFCSGCRFAA